MSSKSSARSVQTCIMQSDKEKYLSLALDSLETYRVESLVSLASQAGMRYSQGYQGAIAMNPAK
jgi:hypothetical protein